MFQPRTDFLSLRLYHKHFAVSEIFFVHFIPSPSYYNKQKGEQDNNTKHNLIERNLNLASQNVGYLMKWLIDTSKDWETQVQYGENKTVNLCL